MPVERLALPNGDWIDLQTRLNHAQSRRIRRAGDDPALDVQTETVAALAAGWSIKGVDGAEIPYPGGGPEGLPSAALDLVPHEAMVEAFVKAADIVAGGPDPNASTATSELSSTPEPPSG